MLSLPCGTQLHREKGNEILSSKSVDPAREGAPQNEPILDVPSRLVLSAVDSFAVKGFNATTTRDITNALGMSAGSLYVHFRSKEDLLFFIARTGHEETLAAVRGAAATSSRPIEQLQAIMRVFTARHASRHKRSRVVSYELSALSAEHFDEIAAIRRSTHAQFREVVDAGILAGDFQTSDAEMTTVALLSLGIDVSRWYRDSGSWTAEMIADHFSQLALRIVGVPPGAP